MNFVIPINGPGLSFQESGYNVPQPFIDVLGLPMVRKVMENVGWEGKYYLLAQHGHKEILEGAMLGCSYEWDVIYGGVEDTPLRVREFIDAEDMLTILNPERLVEDNNWFDGAMLYFHRAEADCGVPCFLSSNGNAFYERGKITDVADGKFISNLSALGAYWFKKGRDFIRAAENVKEFSMAAILNELIHEGWKVVPYMVNSVFGLGTPQDLTEYIRGHK